MTLSCKRMAGSWRSGLRQTAARISSPWIATTLAAVWIPTVPNFRVYRDGTLISAAYQAGSTYTTASQADGTYAYRLTGVDAAGNESGLSAALNVTIDTAVPTGDIGDVTPDPRTFSVNQI